MAAIEHLGSPGAPAWFVLRGRVWEGDERGLVEQALAADGDVTIDLTEVGEITIGGCWALFGDSRTWCGTEGTASRS
jgi:hypothetical protein